MTVLKASRWILNGVSPGQTKSRSHQLLMANGFIHPVGKGLYSILPLGQRVIERICKVIDSELLKIGAQKVSLPILGPKSLWEKTGRWDQIGPEMMNCEDRSNTSFCLQPTAEEMCTDLVSSLSPLKRPLFPLLLYQISEKFRDEMNPRFGLLRSRQFMMKDMYSFDVTYEESLTTYKDVCRAYDKIFGKRLKLDFLKASAESGVHGGAFSHEYHLRSPLEEDFVEFCNECNSYSKPEASTCEHKPKQKICTVEVAHTFHLGTRYSEVLNARFVGAPLQMCCFGIGVTRLLPAIVDALSTKEVMRFPRAVSPFDVVVIPKKSMMTNILMEMVLSSLKNCFGDGVLLDDRIDSSVGKRMHDANRLGIPFVIVMANETERSLNQSPRVELFTTEPSSNALVNHGLMTLTECVTFLQSSVVPYHLSVENERAQSATNKDVVSSQ